MKRLAFPLLGLVLTCSMVAPIFAVSVWTFSTTGGGSVADVEGGWTLTGPNNGGGGNTATYTAIAEEATVYSALWLYQTTDGAHFDRPFFLLNGVQTWLAPFDGTKFLQGSIQIELQAGDVYGWGMFATDSCCGAGVLTITDPLYVVPSPTPSEEPTPTPSQAASLEPSVEPTPEPSPSESPSPDPTPSVEPSPTPTPEPSPSVEPTPSEVPSVQPSPIPSPTTTPKPSPTVDPTPEPSASESATPDPTPVPTDSPSVAPSVEPTPEPTPSPDNIAEQTVAAVGEAVAAVAETVTKAIEAITNLGKDLSPAEKEKAAPVAVAIVISQVASAAVAAASSAAAAARKVTK